MEMELMVLRSTVLDDPIFHCTLMGGDGRRVVGIEQYRCCSIHGNEEVGGAIWIGGIRNNLREVQRAMGRDVGGRKPFKTLGVGCRLSRRDSIIVVAVTI